MMEFLSTGSKVRRSQMSAMRSAASFSTLFRKSDTTARPGWSLASLVGLAEGDRQHVLNAPVASAQPQTCLVRGRQHKAILKDFCARPSRQRTGPAWGL